MAAVVLSVAGTALVVAAGSDVAISRTGIAFALGSAVAFAIYIRLSSRIVNRTAAMTTAAWVAGGAGLSFLTQGLVTSTLHSPSGHWLQLVANAVATASAFTCMFAALQRISPARTSVVMTLEAFFAIVLGAIFLGESMRPLQVVGGVAVLAAAVLVSRGGAPPDAPDDEMPPTPASP